MVFIELITGKAGCGKSYTLSKYINIANTKTNNWIVLAYTHSAVKNIKQYVRDNYSNIDTTNHFKTIHKYFHISFTNDENIINNNTYEYIDYLFIDEFSLVSIKLFSTIWPIIQKYIGKLILCGDYRQLKPIDNIDKISYDNLKNYLSLFPIHVDDIEAIKHFDNLVLSLDVVKQNVKKCVNLITQHRANSQVNKFIERLCFVNSTCKETDKQLVRELVDKHIICLQTLVNLVKNNGYTFISSTYKQLEQVNTLIEKHASVITREQNVVKIVNQINTIRGDDNKTHDMKNKTMKQIYVKLGDNIRITETYNELQNGDIYKLIEVCDNYLLVQNNETEEYKQVFPIINKDMMYYPILPDYLLTFHKSQGLSIDNVIISLDNLFDFTMLYTGISRARENILFYTDKKVNYEIFDIIKHSYNKLDDIMKTIYGNVIVESK